MKTLILLLAALVLIGLNSCGEKTKEVEKAIDIAKKAPDIAEKYEKTQNKAEQVWKERKERGDTLAVNFHKLQEFLPEEIPGYTAEKPTGESMNMMGVSYSEAKRKYIKKLDDGNNETIEITILDYNSASNLYTAATAMWLTNYSYENEQGFGKSFHPEVPDSFGFEEYKTNSKTATVTLAVAYRFIVTIEGTNQKDTENIKQMLKSINLSGLAKL